MFWECFGNKNTPFCLECFCSQNTNKKTNNIHLAWECFGPKNIRQKWSFFGTKTLPTANKKNNKKQIKTKRGKHQLERWLSGRKRLIANPLYDILRTEGSNPSLSVFDTIIIFQQKFERHKRRPLSEDKELHSFILKNEVLKFLLFCKQNKRRPFYL